MIAIRNLTKRYGKTVALDDLTMEVEAGEVLGLIGPNGAGKTTTLKILATLLRPTSGTATLCGHAIDKNPAAIRAVIGFMPDFAGVYEDMRVAEYLYFFSAAYGIEGERADRTVGDVLALTDLAEKADAPMDSLSRGMQQRLGLARVLLHDPKVLLLDEPASGLDPRARIEIKMLLRELRAMGKTILISSHILTELAQFCTSVAIIEAGRLLYKGSVEEALSRTRDFRTGRILVAVAERAEEAKALLASQTGIAEVTQTQDGLAVERSAEGDWTTAGVFDLLSGAGFRLTRLEDEETSLEDAFLHLTRGTVS